MKKSLVLVSLLIGAMALTGCGSDSDGTKSSSTEGTNAGTSNNSTSSSNLVTNKVTCDPEPQISGSISFDSKYFADGDISALCVTQNALTYPEYNLRNGVTNLTVTQVLRDESTDIKTNKGLLKGTANYDYKAGTIHYSGTENGTTINCTETYPSILPLTITNNIDIENIIDWEGDYDNMISTTCPSDWYDEGNDDDFDANDIIGKGTMVTNYTITDSDGKKHLLATEMTMSNSSTLSTDGQSTANDNTNSGTDNSGSTTLLAGAPTYTPITTKITCDPEDMGGFTGDLKFASEGDIIVNCSDAMGDGGYAYELANGVDSIEVSSFVKTIYTKSQNAGGTSISKKIIDFVKGEETYFNIVNGYGDDAKVDMDSCIIKYETSPIILTNKYETKKLFIATSPEIYFQSDEISRTCPKSFVAGWNDSSVTSSDGSEITQVNYELTDVNGKVSKVSSEKVWKY